MINELIIVLTEPQKKELIKRAKAANNDDDHNFFQAHVNEWLSNPEPLKDALTKGMLEARLNHSEK